jgi:hypothetical protein
MVDSIGCRRWGGRRRHAQGGRLWRPLMQHTDDRSLKELLGDLTHSTLFRNEIELAGAEISCPETSTSMARRPRRSVEST